jgi:hypothetical protein
MRTVTTSEARSGFADIIDLERGAGRCSFSGKRDVAVIMSADEYQRLVHLNVSEFQRFCDQVGARAQAAGMTEDVLQELLRDD